MGGMTSSAPHGDQLSGRIGRPGRSGRSGRSGRFVSAAPRSVEAWLAAVRGRWLGRWLLSIWLAATGLGVALVGLWLLLGAPASLLGDLTLAPLLWSLGGIAVAASVAAVLVWGLRPAARALRWLAPRDRPLAENTRSALELSGSSALGRRRAVDPAQSDPGTSARSRHGAPGREASAVFARCHRHQVEQALRGHAPAALIPFGPVSRAARSVALLTFAVGAGLVFVPGGPERLLIQLGATPEVDTLPRVLEGPAVALRRVTVQPPQHTGLPERRLQQLSGPLVVPFGTRVTVDAQAPEPADDLRARLPDGRVIGGALLGDGRLRVQFSARAEGAVSFAVRTRAGWRVGAGLLRLRLEPDRAPEIQVRPAGPLRLPEPKVVRLRWEARDDYGITEVRLVYQVGDGPEVRRRLARAPRFGPRLRARLSGTHEWDLRPLRLGPDRSVRFHLEVEDNRALAGAKGSGPQQGRSPTQQIRIVGKPSDREALMARVRRVFEAVLAALADRLELPEPATAPDGCRAQLGPIRRLQQKERQLGQSLHEMLAAARTHRATLLPVLRETLAGPVARLADRLARLTAADRAALSRGAPACTLRQRAAAGQRQLVPVLEDLVLQLDALVARAILERMKDLVARLDRLRQQIERLREQLRQRPDPATRRRLERKLDEVRRLMAQLSELAGSLGDEQIDEHVNRYALRRQARQRRHRGLDPDRLAQRVEALKRAIASGVDQFRRVMPLPGERARSELRDALQTLVRDQRSLNRRARRGESPRRLAPDQRDLARRARKLARRAAKAPFGQKEAKGLRGAADTLQRAADALARRQGGEAAKVGREGLQALEKVARQVERSARVTRRQGAGADGSEGDDGRVEIPPAGGDLPRELRRRIQESGRASWPPAYREALRRYYERLLR